MMWNVSVLKDSNDDMLSDLCNSSILYYGI
jgi:hypothetical protein